MKSPFRAARLDRQMGRWFDTLRRNEHQLAVVLSLVIGALVGLVVVAFILLTGRMAANMYPAGGAAWRRLVVPTVGALVTGYLLFRYFPQARGSGIPQTKFALFVADGRISFRTVVGKFLCCSASLASGIALGREGPSVHIGAGLASVIARRLGLSAESVKALVPVGCSAALAAAFNTPIAAVLFSLEEVMGDLHAPILGTVVLSSATAWMVLHLFLGDNPLFHVAGYRLVHPSELLIYAVLGVIGGLGSASFTRLLLALRRRFLALGPSSAWIQPVAGGLTVGLLGLMMPEVLGVGYNYVERVLNGDVVLRALVLLAILKIVATAMCYASGNAGGIFGPSLFIGAMIGGAVGTVAHSLLPATTAEPGAYALVGMGTAFAGIIRTPLTSVIMIFELTRDYSVIVPLMISNLLAFYVSHKLQRVPIYEALALQDRIHLPTAESRGHRGAPRVAQAMRPAPECFSPDWSVGEAEARARESELDAWPMADAEGLTAMIGRADLQSAIADGMRDVSLAEFSRRVTHGRAAPLPHLHPDHTLALALERIGSTPERVLPVVSRANIRQLVGIVSFADILDGFKVAPSTISDDDPELLPTAPIDGSSFFATLAIIVTSLAVLAVVDSRLAAKERSDTGKQAMRLFAEGNHLEQQAQHSEAIDRFRSALSLKPNDRDYQVALAGALSESGNGTDAETLLGEVLRRQPTDGEANLMMARILSKRNAADAPSYYHRAIYGRWPHNEASQTIAARLELVDVLAKRGATDDLLSELLPLQDKLGDERVRHRIARLYLSLGAPDRALQLLSSMLPAHPDDATVYADLGEAELALRSYRAARSHFQAARRLDPSNQQVRERLALCTDVLALDPTQRGLSSTARYARSVNLVALARDSVSRCAADALGPSDVAAGLSPKATERERDEAAEANLDLAERLWAVRTSHCSSPLSGTDETLALVLTKTSH